LKSSQINDRKWIGIDQSEKAIEATIKKLETIESDLFNAKPEYDFIELDESTNIIIEMQDKLGIANY
jgi:adenine-specific DNA-methyltransferase